MDKAAYVLIGVVVGVVLNTLKEWIFQRTKSRKDLEYLAIRIVCILDTFVVNCADVVADNGLNEGRPGSDGRRSVQVERPSFEPLSLDVEWKSLPAPVMYDILNFPNLIEAANHLIDSSFNTASSPDYEEGFEDRQLQYAELGIKAHALSTRLRKLGKLPQTEVVVSNAWDPIRFMKEKQTEIKQLQEVRAAHHKALMEKIDAHS